MEKKVVDDGGYFDWKCPECNYMTDRMDTYEPYDVGWYFCPRCGVRLMEEKNKMTHEIIDKDHIRLDVNFNELLSLRNLAKATRHDDLCSSLDAVISDLAERCKE